MPPALGPGKQPHEPVSRKGSSKSNPADGGDHSDSHCHGHHEPGRLGSEADIIRDVALIRLAAISSGLASVANGYPDRESQVVPRAPCSHLIFAACGPRIVHQEHALIGLPQEVHTAIL